jgi:hypothetical protein
MKLISKKTKKQLRGGFSYTLHLCMLSILNFSMVIGAAPRPLAAAPVPAVATTASAPAAAGTASTSESVQQLAPADPVVPLALLRTGYSATELPDGRIVVAGGYTPAGQVVSSTEIYDPATKASTLSGSLNAIRFDHTATLLPDGRILIAGGANGVNVLRSTEIYDPASGNSIAGPDLSVARVGHTATSLRDGRLVAITGGDAAGSTDMFESRAARFLSLAAKSSGTATSRTSGSIGDAPSTGGATITTDREDYPPYSIVFMQGSGFAPGETVHLVVEQIAPDPQSYPGWTTDADANGNIETEWLIDGYEFAGTTLKVTATGQFASASAIFTDALGAGIPETGDVNGFNIDGGLRSISLATGPGALALPRTDWLNNSGSGLFGLVNDNGTPKTVASGPVYSVNLGSGDAYGSNDDVFANGNINNKADGNPNLMTWATGNSTGKTDLNRVYVHISRDLNNEAWVTASADRMDRQGASFVDFELNQAPITKNGDNTFSSDGPNNGRTTGDMLITAEYTGSSTPNLKVYKCGSTLRGTLPCRVRSSPRVTAQRSTLTLIRYLAEPVTRPANS